MKLEDKELINAFGQRKRCPVCGKELNVNNATIKRQEEEIGFKSDLQGIQLKSTSTICYYWSYCCKTCRVRLIINSIIVRFVVILGLPMALWRLIMFIGKLQVPYVSATITGIGVIVLMLWVFWSWWSAFNPFRNGRQCKIVGKMLKPIIGKYRIDYEEAELVNKDRVNEHLSSKTNYFSL